MQGATTSNSVTTVTGSSMTRAARRVQSRARIVRAATEILLARGSAELSMKEVAESADFTAGALYRYFDSKDALVSAVLVEVLNGLGTTLRALEAETAEEDVLARVALQVAAYVRFSAESPNAYALITRLAAEPEVIFQPDDAGPLLHAWLGALGPLQRCLEQAAGERAIESGRADRRALVLYAGVSGVLQLRKQERQLPGLIDAHEMAGELVVAQLIGLGADPIRSAAAVRRAFQDKPSSGALR